MTMRADALDRLTTRAREDPGVLAVLLFGSAARGGRPAPGLTCYLVNRETDSGKRPDGEGVAAAGPHPDRTSSQRWSRRYGGGSPPLM